MEQLILILLILILIFTIYNRRNIETYINSVIDPNFKTIEKLKSDVDDKKYVIQSEFSNKKNAVNMLSELNNICIYFINILKKKYPYDKRIKLLHTRYNPEKLIEGSPLSGSTSYSISKGKNLVYCIRSKKNLEIHNKNLLMFVVIHELAHLASTTYGHNTEFVRNFRFLLKEGIKLGIYKRINFYNDPKEYCGMTINTTPI